MSVLASFDNSAQALDFVADFLECLLTHNGPQGGSMAFGAVFDIDDTMLMDDKSSVGGNSRAVSDTGENLELPGETLELPGETLEPAVTLLWRLCGELGMRRYIVTARPAMALSGGDTNEAYTIRQLRAAGITGWDALYMMPYREYKRCRGDASAYKERARRDIMARHNDGLPLVVNIGDQWGDMGHGLEDILGAPDDAILVGYFDDTAVVGVKLPSRD